MNAENILFKSGNCLQFEFKGKLIKAEVVKKDGDGWILLFGKDVGGSWFRAFKKGWLMKNAVLTGDCDE